MLSACAAPVSRVDVGVANPPPAPEPVRVLPQAPSAAASSGASANAAASPAQAIESGPEAAAVAAHFPDPAQRFATPAFQPGRSDFTSSGELRSLMSELVSVSGSSPRIEPLDLGRSQRGQPLEAWLFTRLGDVTPAAVQASGRPTVLLVAQQHGDEPAGAEALIVIAQQLTQGPLAPLLDRINVLLVPRANPDGAQAARRETASGIDMNRDHLLLRTPEAQALASLVRDYRPMVVADAHEFSAAGLFRDKFGAVPRVDALLQYATTANMHGFVTRAAEEWFRRPLVKNLQREGLRSDWYHTLSPVPDDKRVAMGSTRPDNSRNVDGLTNAISLLVESRGVGIGRQHLARRVQTQVVALSSVLQSAAARADDLVKLRNFVDQDISSKVCQGEAVIDAGPTPSEYELRMLDAQTGAERAFTVSWDSALELQVLKKRARPCGYWLSAEQADVVTRLRALGVVVQRVEEIGGARGESYREQSSAPAASAQGHVADSGEVTLVKVQTVPALIDMTPGSWFVGLDQPLANLVIAALEPDTASSYFAHGLVTRLGGVARVLARPEMRLQAVP